MDSPHILIAEDEKHLRVVLSMLLKQEGFDVSEAADGLEAFFKVVDSYDISRPIQLVILDIQMPQLDGLELMDWLREEHYDIPVIAISGYGNNDLVAELTCRGCTEYIDKPFVAEEILNRIEKVLMAA